MPLRKPNRTFCCELISEARIAWEYIRFNVSASAELRVTFALQVLGMMVNDTSFVLVWVFFISAFGQINGWSGPEVVAMQGLLTASYGIAFTLFSGTLDLPTAINNGAFDSILLTPRNLYLRILTISTHTSSFGDLLYGLTLILSYAIIAHQSISQVGLTFLMLVPAVIILVNFALICACIGFYVPDADDLARSAFELMLGPSLYPSGVFQGAMRVIFLFVLPSIAIAGLPVEAIKSLDFRGVLIVWLLAAVWSVVAQLVLKQGIKRYESGNLTGARI